MLPTHPSSFRHLHPHAEKFRDFENDLLETLKGGFAKYEKYTDVYVLLVHWEDNDLPGILEEVAAMKEVFDVRFRFHTEEFVIPSIQYQTQFQLSQRIIQLQADHPDPTNLFIIYYNGHGAYDERDMSYWYPRA